MKTFRKAALIVVLLAVLILGASGIVITRENEYSLIRQFGRIEWVVSEAGISFKIPFIRALINCPSKYCCTTFLLLMSSPVTRKL